MVLRGLFLANLRPSRSLSRSGLGLSSSPSPSLRSPRFHPSLLLSIDALLPFLSFFAVFARSPPFFFSISFLSHTTSFRSFHPFSFLFFSAPLDLATLFRVNPRAGDRFSDSKRHRRRSNVPSPRNIPTRRPIVGRHARARSSSSSSLPSLSSSSLSSLSSLSSSSSSSSPPPHNATTGSLLFDCLHGRNDSHGGTRASKRKRERTRPTVEEESKPKEGDVCVGGERDPGGRLFFYLSLTLRRERAHTPEVPNRRRSSSFSSARLRVRSTPRQHRARIEKSGTISRRNADPHNRTSTRRCGGCEHH